MVYEDIFDAKNACDHLSGFNVCNRYLVVLYYNANRVRMISKPLRQSGKIYCDGKPQRVIVSSYLHNHLVLSFVNLAGFPKDGHKEKRGAVETSKREIWNQHRPSEIAFLKPFFSFMSRVLLFCLNKNTFLQ